MIIHEWSPNLPSTQALSDGDMETAQALGDEASADGLEALAALPATSAIDANTIQQLKYTNNHRLADSLANVKRMLDSTDFSLNMMSGLANLEGLGDFGKGNSGGSTVIQNKIASKPNIDSSNAFHTYISDSVPFHQVRLCNHWLLKKV